MRLADAPLNDATDGAVLTLPPELLQVDVRLEPLFAPFRECVVLHEALTRDRGTSGPTRLLMAELRGDRFDEICAVVQRACPMSAFVETLTDNDDVAAGREWRERGVGAFSVFVYRLFGGSTAIHVSSARGTAMDARARAILDSPLAILAELVESTSNVEHVSCLRSARAAPQWHLQASFRDARRFEEIATRVVALGFEERRGKYWREQIIVQPVGKERWMAAAPGIDFGPQGRARAGA